MKLSSLLLAAALATFAGSAAGTEEVLSSGVPGDQDGEFGTPNANRIVGLWSVSVNVGPCGAPASQRFTALNTFHAGGTLSDSNTAAGSARGPGHGVWAHRGRGLYDTRFQFFRFQPNGALDGLQDISQELVIDGSGRTYESMIRARVLNVDGSLRAQLCGAAVGQRITIVDSGGPPRTPVLDGTRWRATEIDDGLGAAASIAAPLEATLEFDADGTRVRGFAGCNSYAASSKLVGAVVTIGPLVVSKRVCVTPEGVMAVEARFLAALTSVTVAQGDDNYLQLRSSDGTRAISLLRYTAQ